MHTKQDFLDAAKSAIDSGQFSAIAPLYHAQDPRIHQHIDAVATMLSMLSQQISVAQAEIFSRERADTALADLSMKGFVFGSVPQVVRCSSSTGQFPAISEASLSSTVYSEKGAPFQHAGGGLFYQCIGKTTKVTVKATEPFFRVYLDRYHDNGEFASASVFIDGQGKAVPIYGGWTVNSKNQFMYTLQYDIDGRPFVEFPNIERQSKVVTAGMSLTIVALYSLSGAGDVKIGDKLSHDYAGGATYTVTEVQRKGAAIPSARTLSRMSASPYIYDRNAVFLGEFELLARHAVGAPNMFLSVWNEAIQERATGSANIKNVNTLFIAIADTDGEEAEPIVGFSTDNNSTLPNDNGSPYGSMTEIKWETKTSARWQRIKGWFDTIKEAINRADDSYRVIAYHARLYRPRVTINASISSVYDRGTVEARVRDLMLDRFGRNQLLQPFAKISRREVYSMLTKNVPELSAGDSDIEITIANNSATYDKMPDIIRFIDNATLTVNITHNSETVRGW